jgi:phosphatidate cytidylyltransferase
MLVDAPDRWRSWWKRFCATAVLFAYGRLLANEFDLVIPYHSFICFAMYAAGILWFVFSLQAPHYKYQFGLFAWVQLTLLIIVMQSSFLIMNMFQGLIW